MTWTYGGNPALNPRDEVRFLLGDTDTTDQQLADEEIVYLLGKFPEPIVAAAEACVALQSKYARLVNTTNLSLSVSAGDRLKNYKDLEDRLRARFVGQFGTIYAGGLTKAEKDADDADTGAVQPDFKIGMDDMPGSSPDTARPSWWWSR